VPSRRRFAWHGIGRRRSTRLGSRFFPRKAAPAIGPDAAVNFHHGCIRQPRFAGVTNLQQVHHLQSQNGRPNARTVRDRKSSAKIVTLSAVAFAMKDNCYSVHMVASKSCVIYIGMTNDLSRRVFGHKNELVEGFTKHYRCHRLVFFDDVTKRQSNARISLSRGVE
jgi:putative endonuclease